MKFDIDKFMTAADHAGSAFKHGLNAVAHFVQAVAPVAGAVGSAIGNKEVTQAAKLAEKTATVAAATTEEQAQ